MKELGLIARFIERDRERKREERGRAGEGNKFRSLLELEVDEISYADG